MPPLNSESVTKVIGAVLAAGAASRFGRPKQLAKFGTRTLIDIAIDALDTAAVDEACIVLGCNFELIDSHLSKRSTDAGALQTLFNSDWQRGLSTSIRCATEFAIDRHATHLLLLTCDQPFVNAELVTTLLKNLSLNSVVACKYGDTTGIPAVFPKNLFEELLQLEGDRGAKSVIQKHVAGFVAFPDGVHDIDHPADLAMHSVLTSQFIEQ
jgi:molybdenum cofactor cytidylyltransferase